jgi:hypothetical protein
MKECVVNTLVNYTMLQNEFGMNGIYCFFAMNGYISSLVLFKLFLHIVRLDARKMTLCHYMSEYIKMQSFATLLGNILVEVMDVNGVLLMQCKQFT